MAKASKGATEKKAPVKKAAKKKAAKQKTPGGPPEPGNTPEQAAGEEGLATQLVLYDGE